MICACSFWGGVGCGSGSPEYGDAPSGSGAQLRWEFGAGAPSPETFLVLVDDTQAGAGLRDALATAFDDLDAQRAIRRAGCAAPVDPAAWHPIDRSVVLLHPSTPGALGYSSPAQDPALRLQAQQTFGPERARWMAAVRAGINAQPAAPAAPFQALAALSNADSLLLGLRAPQNAEEEAVLDALPSPLSFAQVIALATEDASPGEAEQYPRELRSELLSVVLPAREARERSDCSERGVPTTPRYQAFSESAQAWPCQNPQLLPADLWSECSTSCLLQPIAIDAGIAQCRAIAKYPGREPCPAELGWLDPIDGSGQRSPRLDGGEADATRVCEIRQLEGAALDACVTRLDCAGCEPGWCATEVPELVPRSVCTTGSHYPPFRFVLGAGQARRAEVTVVCNEAPR